MNVALSKFHASPSPPTFIGLFFALSGWVLIETSLYLVRARFQAHLMLTLMAIYLAFSCTKQMKLKESSSASLDFSAVECSSIGSKTGCAFFLLTIGAFNGVVILSESVLFGILAAAISWFPCLRIPLCRDHIFLSSFIALFGMTIPLLTFHQTLNPLSLIIFAWLFWVYSTSCILTRITLLWQAERKRKTITAAKTTVAK